MVRVWEFETAGRFGFAFGEPWTAFGNLQRVYREFAGFVMVLEAEAIDEQRYEHRIAFAARELVEFRSVLRGDLRFDVVALCTGP